MPKPSKPSAKRSRPRSETVYIRLDRDTVATLEAIRRTGLLGRTADAVAQHILRQMMFEMHLRAVKAAAHLPKPDAKRK